MADKGIIFSAPMVRALLDGRKTQTRRLLTVRGHRKISKFGVSDTPGYDWHFRREDGCWCDYRAADLPLPYAPGDRLYVREHWKTSRGNDGVAPRNLDPMTPVLYLANGAEAGKYPVGTPGQHRQGMHMPRWASRLWIAVTDVRVQRLQDISEEDAIVEGIEQRMWDVESGDDMEIIDGWSSDRFHAFKHGCGETAREGYAILWNSLHAAPGTRWKDNPWIVAVTFDVHGGNIDE